MLFGAISASCCLHGFFWKTTRRERVIGACFRRLFLYYPVYATTGTESVQSKASASVSGSGVTITYSSTHKNNIPEEKGSLDDVFVLSCYLSLIGG